MSPVIERPSRFRTGTKITAAGAAVIAMVATFEGVRQTVYADPVGIPTVCFGSTKGLTKEMVGKARLSMEECKELLVDEVVEHEQGMRACLPTPDALPESVYAAMASFAYNVGTGAFCKSTAAKYLRAGNWRAACDELPKWVKARGITLPGLVKRRAAERAHCLKGIPA